MLEFTLVAIPVIFMLISIFELARGMWAYNTISHAVKEAARFAVVHGNNCSNYPNNCTVTIGRICSVLQYRAGGLLPGDIIDIRLSRFTQEYGPFTMSQCLASTEVFPSQAPYTLNALGEPGQPVEIRAAYRFNSALSFFWTGQRGYTFGRFNLGAVSRELIQY